MSCSFIWKCFFFGCISDGVCFCAGGRNGGEVPDLASLGSSEDMASLWANYHSALGLAKGKATPPAPREQSVSIGRQSWRLVILMAFFGAESFS